MSTLKVLKEYLVGDGGYLLNDDNNGKTVMLSGAWGSGKTHFWQKNIEEDLTKELNAKEKACVYVSLYGKDNIEAIKNEILFKAYESIKDENKLAKRAISAFGFGSRLLSVSVGGVRANTGAVGDAVEGFFESKKIDEAESFLADGGLICLDDFERKSKHIDLNDLFGFIAQLAIDMNCKIVIILNSDVFEGEEANVFKTVKEKTVNKYFYFNPESKELFKLIYKSDEKYKKLDKYYDEILKVIEETEELNARIYIQVLDNCLEWLTTKNGIENIRPLILNTICFVLNSCVLGYYNTNMIREANTSYREKYLFYSDIDFEHEINSFFQKRFQFKDMKSKIVVQPKVINFFNDLNEHITGVKSNDTRVRLTVEMQKILLDNIDDNFDKMQCILRFGYQLFVARDIEKDAYEEMSKFIESGILPKNNKEPSS